LRRRAKSFQRDIKLHDLSPNLTVSPHFAPALASLPLNLHGMVGRKPKLERVPMSKTQALPIAAGQPRFKANGVLRFTPSQWRAILESHGFLERPDNRFQHPRRFLGAWVQIIPDESFR
jgi:hypothetical protein